MPDLSQRRIQDPILTRLAQGYQNENFIGLNLFPVITVDKESGKYVKFYKEKLIARSTGDMAVGMGAEPKFIDFETMTSSYTLDEYATGTKIYKRELEEANNILQLKTTKQELISSTMAVFIEKSIADFAQDDSNYTNFNLLDNTGAGKYKWSHANADPLANIQTAIDSIKNNTGMYPDTIIFGYASASQLAQVTDIQRLVAPNYAQALRITPQQACQTVANFFGIKNMYIGLSMYATSYTSALSQIWSDNCIVAYVGKDTLASKTTQNFGALLRKRGRPVVQREIIPLSDQTQALMIRDMWQIHQINDLCGYLIEDTV